MRILLAVTLLVACASACVQTTIPSSSPRNGADQKGKSYETQTPSDDRQPQGVPRVIFREESTSARNTQTQHPDKEPSKVWEKAFSPETWSTWAYVVITLGAVIVAFRTLRIIKQQTQATKRAAEAAEKTLLLTERADILVEAVSISNHPIFDGDSIIGVVLKNYGRTRASGAEAKAELLIPEIDLLGEAPRIATTIVAPGASMPITFVPMRDFLTKETFDRISAGELVLRFEVEVSYRDVFDIQHRTRSSGSFIPRLCCFAVDRNQEAD